MNPKRSSQPTVTHFRPLRTRVLAAIFLPAPLFAQILQNVRIRMNDGVSLDATIGRPLGLPPSGGLPAVILIHGYGGDKSEMNTLMQVMGIYGYASLSHSVQGQDASEELFTTMGDRERQDLLDVIHCLRQAPFINPNKLGVIGGSQGRIHSWLAAI
jgi:ABC-2 type transport system ATP-binding protein